MPTGVPDDLTGQRFGYWIALERVVEQGKRVRYWCRCLCGYEALVHGSNLSSGATTRCRNCANELRRVKWKAQKNNLIGRHFGDWYVIGFAGREMPSGQRLWLCRCICGNTEEQRAPALVNGVAKGCRECYEMDQAARLASNRLTWLHERLGERPGYEPADLTGQRFGRWTVLFFSGYTRHRARLWMCLCACGYTSTVMSYQLKSGDSTQCRRCAGRQAARKLGQRRRQGDKTTDGGAAVHDTR